MFMKHALCIFGLALSAASHAQSEATNKPFTIHCQPYDCSKPILLPEHEFAVSQFGRGKYRIDGSFSEGHFNCIYIIFQATDALLPVPDAVESTFAIKKQKITWRSYKTIVEGRSVIRREALMPNILPHEKRGVDSDYIWIHIDADSQQILDQLTSDAERILEEVT